MAGLPVTIRLLDPPLHEFVPHQLATQKDLADDMHISLDQVKRKVAELEELILCWATVDVGWETPIQKLLKCKPAPSLKPAMNLKDKGIEALPEIMVPLAGTVKEYTMQEDIIRETAAKVFEERGDSIEFKVGTMIEIPGAALTADLIAHRGRIFLLWYQRLDPNDLRLFQR